MKTTQEITILSGRKLCFKLRKHRKARNPSVSVTKQDGAVVTLPWRFPKIIVPRLLSVWEDWLTHQVQAHGVWDGPVVREFVSGTVVSVFGQPCKLVLEKLSADRKRPTARLEANSLFLCLPTSQMFEPRPELEKFLRRLAKTDLMKRVEDWSEVVGKKPTKVIVGERKSRWGSCSRRGTLSFCYRLVMAPPETIDAVVAHEVCHLVHLNHSKRFYTLLDKVCPGHRTAMEWLTEHPEDLMI